MGRINDSYGAPAVLPTWAVLPVVLTVVFAALYAATAPAGDIGWSACKAKG